MICESASRSLTLAQERSHSRRGKRLSLSGRSQIGYHQHSIMLGRGGNPFS